MRSVIFSLVDPVECCVLDRGLPNNGLKFSAIETSNPTSFPGWPSFGDLLCDGGSRTVVGITFHIPSGHYSAAEKTVRELSPTIVELKRFDASSNLGIYENYPESSWLEIKWSSVTPNQIIDIQTCDVLWYNHLNLSNGQFPVALGIEHLENLIKEADYDLIAPTTFPFPSLAIEFLND